MDLFDDSKQIPTKTSKNSQVSELLKIITDNNYIISHLEEKVSRI